ncbi:chromosome segregation protein SMC [Phocoenobacter uteri]|uniref:Chromosome segregation protein SMC n=1 Tax=Phocoenobacter uteri TaxID=146806 RepID=A0A379CCG7_9PAST|nr:YadA-like family protein [Phocoenobacter uteri]MDG6881866.1 hypothetical protein [Phocoenobacter uteri]SUB59904.1 chromosome segregation protein SMC [Phocoenobacter uteri]
MQKIHKQTFLSSLLLLTLNQSFAGTAIVQNFKAPFGEGVPSKDGINVISQGKVGFDNLKDEVTGLLDGIATQQRNNIMQLAQIKREVEYLSEHGSTNTGSGVANSKVNQKLVNKDYEYLDDTVFKEQANNPNIAFYNPNGHFDRYEKPSNLDFVSQVLNDQDFLVFADGRDVKYIGTTDPTRKDDLFLTKEDIAFLRKQLDGTRFVETINTKLAEALQQYGKVSYDSEAGKVTLSEDEKITLSDITKVENGKEKIDYLQGITLAQIVMAKYYMRSENRASVSKEIMDSFQIAKKSEEMVNTSPSATKPIPPKDNVAPSKDDVSMPSKDYIPPSNGSVVSTNDKYDLKPMPKSRTDHNDSDLMNREDVPAINGNEVMNKLYYTYSRYIRRKNQDDLNKLKANSKESAAYLSADEQYSKKSREIFLDKYYKDQFREFGEQDYDSYMTDEEKIRWFEMIQTELLDSKIKENSANIETNKSQVKEVLSVNQENKSNIEKNAIGIKNNALSMTKHSQKMENVEQQIKNNKSEISRNTSKIKNNALTIANNSQDIDKVKQQVTNSNARISRNTSDIKSNALKIVKNTQDVDVVKRQVQHNKSEIISNTSNIKHNITNIQRNMVNIAQNSQRIQTIEKQIGKLENKQRASAASSVATAGLLQANQAGQSGITAAVGQYQNQTALAIGYSALSTDSKIGVKASVNTNTAKEFSGAVSVGYFW